MLETATKATKGYHSHDYISYLFIFFIFVSSRLIMIIAIAFSSWFIPQKIGSEYWNINSSWYHYLLRYDSGWYLYITSNGYTYNGNDLLQHPVVFYPFYPLLSRATADILGINQALAMLIVSNASIIIAILLLFILIKNEYGGEIALYAISLISFFPTSLFFSSGYTESLTFLLIVAFFLFLGRRQFFLAAGCAGLALATRSTGVILLPSLLFEVWHQCSEKRMRLIIYMIIYTILATSGLWLYMIYLWIAFRKPLAFVTAQRAWHSVNEIGSNLFHSMTLQPFLRLADIFLVGPQIYALDPWFFLFFLIILIPFGQKLAVSHRIFALGVLLLPYFTFAASSGFRSFTRYILLAFPVFIIMADMFRRNLWLCLCVTAFFASLLFMYTALFAQWHWVG
jgi:Gpi18-like mannosyltransferase